MSNKTLGTLVSVLGAIVLLLFALADIVGIGQTPNQIGYRQLLGVIAGALIFAAGVYISRR
jgi:uncharacterized membrane protein